MINHMESMWTEKRNSELPLAPLLSARHPCHISIDEFNLKVIISIKIYCAVCAQSDGNLPGHSEWYSGTSASTSRWPAIANVRECVHVFGTPRALPKTAISAEFNWIGSGYLWQIKRGVEEQRLLEYRTSAPSTSPSSPPFTPLSPHSLGREKKRSPQRDQAAVAFILPTNLLHATNIEYGRP